jgi:DNA polymerase III epsilon subunit family exonuclease
MSVLFDNKCTGIMCEMGLFNKIFKTNSTNQIDTNFLFTEQRSKSKPNSSNKNKYYKGPMFAAPGEISNIFGYGSFDSDFLLNAPYSIIDIETSALSPSNGYIVEISIHKVDSSGKKIKEFSTLIKPPDGYPGKSEIHGINKTMLKKAPVFEEVVGNIFDTIKNSIIVAHNAKFEEKFINMELSRIGIEIPPLPTLDTLWLSQVTYELNNYKLQTVVNHLGSKIIKAHTAAGDTRAVAKILPKILKDSKKLKYPVEFNALPKISLSKKILSR